MSWDDNPIKTIKCPCGEGVISQSSKSDDWGRTEYYLPQIECPKCSQKYRVEEVKHHHLLASDGSWSTYYLTPKNYPEYNGITEASQFPTKTYSVRDFDKWFIENYTKDDLQNALHEFRVEKSSSKVISTLSKEIVKGHKAAFENAKVIEIIPRLQKIINIYDTYFGNYEQRKPIRDEEKRQRDIYTTEKRKHQICLSL